MRVLVIEDEETLRNAMVRGLRKIEGADVVGAATFGEALRAIDERAPLVVVSDLDLPDRPGVELLGELGRRAIQCPITFVSAYVRAFSAQIPRHADVRVREKPLSLDELREIVRSDLERVRGPRHAPSPFSLADYVQLACMGGHSVRIEIRGAERGRGEVLVVGGRLHAARDAEGVGDGAFKRLAFRETGTLTCVALDGDAGEPNVQGSWEGLLLDAARERDEGARDGGDDDEAALDAAFSSQPPAALPRGPAADPSPELEALAAFQRAFDAGVEALLARDHATALACFERAEVLQPGDRRVAANLTRLGELMRREERT